MGTVWQARRDVGGSVAVKLIRWIDPDEPRLNPGVPREFELAAELSHPNVMPVIDTGIHRCRDGRDRFFIVMPLLEDAKPLDRFVAEHQLDPLQRLRLFIALVAAISHVHDRGLAHLDLKPSNILVDGHGHLRLADFGIARLLVDPPRRNEVGTPAYRAPEQRGEVDVTRLDSRADTWALGVLLHELLTGELPRAARTVVPGAGDGGLSAGARHALGLSPPPPRDGAAASDASGTGHADTGSPGVDPLGETAPELRSAIPHLLPGIDALIADCLQADRSHRPRNAHAVLQRLRGVVEATGVATIAGRLVGGRPRLVATAAATTAVVASAMLAIALSAIVLAVTPMPSQLLRRVAPAPIAAPTTAWPDVVVAEFAAHSLAALSGIVPEAQLASADPLARRTWRSLHAAAIRELADRPPAERPRTIFVDVFFETPDEGQDPAFAAAIAHARARGIQVVLAAERNPPSPGAPPPISPRILQSGAAWGTTAIAEVLQASGAGPTIQVDLAVLRDGRLLAPAAVLEAAVAHRLGRDDVRYRLDPEGIVAVPADRRWLDDEAGLIVPFTAIVPAPATLDLLLLGVRPGDELVALEIPVATAHSYDASRHDYASIWEDAAGPPLPSAGRTVVIVDGEQDPLRPNPVGRAGRGLAQAVQAIVDGHAIRLAGFGNVPLLLAGCAAGAAVGLASSRGHERRTAHVRPDGGRRTRPSSGRVAATMAGGLAASALLVVPATAVAFVLDLLVLHPLPAIVGGTIAAGATLLGPRAADVVAGLAPRHRPRSTTSTSFAT